MKELGLKEIQHESLKILIEVDKICRELNLTYFLAYGTLIGAIRHHGFIPWDDDVDIMMPRNDFNVLMNYFEKNKDRLYPLKLCNRLNTKNYWFGIPRICNMEYKYVTYLHNEKQYDIGTFIDVYPLDNYGDNKESIKNIYNKISRINSKYGMYINGKSFTNKFKGIFKYIYHLYLRVFHKNYVVTVTNQINEIVEDINSHETKYVGIPTWDGNDCLPFEKELFNESIEWNFEGNMLQIPKEYDVILTKIYGDYMKLPPEKDRIPHHNYKIYRRKDLNENEVN